jgi:hypothetical protein
MFEQQRQTDAQDGLQAQALNEVQCKRKERDVEKG